TFRSTFAGTGTGTKSQSRTQPPTGAGSSHEELMFAPELPSYGKLSILYLGVQKGLECLRCFHTLVIVRKHGTVANGMQQTKAAIDGQPPVQYQGISVPLLGKIELPDGSQ
ncbi:hypothetical protein SCARD494_14293, partial [Seiridium cardinale]